MTVADQGGVPPFFIFGRNLYSLWLVVVVAGYCDWLLLRLVVAVDAFKKGFGIDVAGHAKSRSMSLISDVQIRRIRLVLWGWFGLTQFK